MSETASEHGKGWAAANLADLGDGPGFRKIRRALGVEAFGVNAIVLPPGVKTGYHYHDRQEELYFLHAGEVEMQFGDGESVRLSPGSAVRVDAAVPRRICNVGEGEAVYICVGGEGGYVGRDGRLVEGEERGPSPVDRP
ncbi:MAG TPA: cupin domain-containing protein [Solirubrobacteraceae bacterium]|nr:cupin domain-containing protein [Solirubrobacteraceae bacterium]